MGQKVNPIGFRLGGLKTWDSKWFATRSYTGFFREDMKIKDFLRHRLPYAAVSQIEIERTTDKIRILLHTARPGIVIGRRGGDIERLQGELREMTGKQVIVDIREIQRPALDARLVAENVAEQLEKRVAFRRVMKRAVGLTIEAGARGVKVCCAGRLAGTEMCRRELYKEGRIPLHTLKANIDYGQADAHTTYGIIGVKVWIFTE